MYSYTHEQIIEDRKFLYDVIVNLSEEYLSLKKIEELSPIIEVEIIKPKIPLVISSEQLLCDSIDVAVKDSIDSMYKSDVSNNHSIQSKESKKRKRSNSITQEEWNKKNTLHFEPFDF
jgi:hypothetical protein